MAKDLDGGWDRYDGKDLFAYVGRADTAGRKPPGPRAQGPLQALSGIVFLVSLLAVFAAALGEGWLAEREMEWILLPLAGTAFGSMGLLLLSQKQIFGAAFFIVGTAMAGFSLGYRFGGEGMRSAIEQAVPVALLSVFPVAGLLMIVVPPVLRGRKKRRYTMAVDAEVVKRSQERRTHMHKGHHRTVLVYVLTWRYCANGEWVTWKSNFGSNAERRDVGDRGTLYLDPDDIRSVWEPDTDKGANAILFFMGLAFLFTGLTAMAGLLGFL